MWIHLSLSWWSLSIANFCYSTIIIGGMLLISQRRLRADLHREVDAIKAEIPTNPIGEAFVREQFAGLEYMLREYNARLTTVEGLLEALCDPNHKA